MCRTRGTSSFFHFIQYSWLTGSALGVRLAVVMKLVQQKQWMKLGGHKIRQNHSVIAVTETLQLLRQLTIHRSLGLLLAVGWSSINSLCAQSDVGVCRVQGWVSHVIPATGLPQRGPQSEWLFSFSAGWQNLRGILGQMKTAYEWARIPPLHSSDNTTE